MLEPVYSVAMRYRAREIKGKHWSQEIVGCALQSRETAEAFAQSGNEDMPIILVLPLRHKLDHVVQ